MNDKKLPNVLFYYTSLVYLELIFRVFCTENIFPVTFINTLIYLIIIALFLSIITSLSNEKINTIFSPLNHLYAVVPKQGLGNVVGIVGDKALQKSGIKKDNDFEFYLPLPKFLKYMKENPSLNLVLEKSFLDELSEKGETYYLFKRLENADLILSEIE